ncbi:hypothetical protein, partial [Salmonella enterica]|uniref:hypothetical protein n=1 Tax=Salmonella enterica TaxID=28901 RepID=UPI003FA78E44
MLTQLMGGVFKDGSLLSGPAMLMDAFEGGAASLVPGQVSSTLGNLAPGLDNLLSLDKAALPNALDVLNLLETLQTALPGLANTPGA